MHRLGLPELRPETAAVAPTFRHPIDVARRELIVRTYRELFPAGAAAEVEEAARLAAHEFTFLGYTMRHGATIAWSRDPVSGRDWPATFSQDIPYRGPERLGDIKLPWELNKHQYFFTLGKAAWLQGDPAKALEIVQQIDHWIRSNPYGTGIHWISALEAGTRAVSWIMAYPFYAEHCDESFRARLTTSLAEHFMFVERHLSVGRFTNTHLVGEAAALVAGGLFVNCRHSERWLATGVTTLDEQIVAQVTRDGVHAERSVAYHRFFLDNYYLAEALLRANGRSLAPATLAQMERMTDVLMHLLFADGSAPAFGDGDDARALWLRADCPTDYRGLLALGSVLFNRGDFRSVARNLAEEVLWLLGPEGVVAFEGLAAHAPDDTSVGYPDGGYFVMRGGWSPPEPVLVFDCGALGHGPAGHGHADALSFQLHAGGYPFLVDSGTFSYNLDYAWRDAFRSTRAHNTIVVDGQEQSVPLDRMSWTTMAKAGPGQWISTPWFDLADGEHSGYTRFPDPVIHRRLVCFLKPDMWIVWDGLRARQDHFLELLFHVRPDCALAVGTGGHDALLTSPDGLGLVVWIPEADSDHRLEVLSGSERERGAWFSPSYGIRVPSRALRATRTFDADCRLVTCLATTTRHRPAVALAPEGIGFRVTYEDAGEDRVSYFADGAGALDADGARFKGTLLYQRRTDGICSVTFARCFTELAIEGVLEVRSAHPIDSLEQVGNRCHISLAEQHVGSLHVRSRDEMECLVNGRRRVAADALG